MPGISIERNLRAMRIIKHQLHHKDVILNPCMGFAELLNFEKANMIRFPAEYRMFLTEICNGLICQEGPCREGILPFGRIPLGYPLDFTNIENNLRKYFPYEEKSVSERNYSLFTGKSIGGYVILGSTMNLYNHWWILICNGDCRGEVWIVNWAGSFFPCVPRMSFKDWLQDWLQDDGYKLHQSLRNADNHWFLP